LSRPHVGHPLPDTSDQVRLHKGLHTSTRGRRGFDYLIVGAGFAGSVLAERLAAAAGKRVLLIDRRPHIGGNAYDEYDTSGIMVHRYGPHIFHTNAAQIERYLSQFTKWRPYEHRVLARVDRMLLPIPINLTTINRLYGLNLDTSEVQEFLAARAEPVAEARTSEDVVVGRVGRELYEKFFRGYTRKQWGVDPSELDKSVTARVPTRVDTDDRYFTDNFQNMPLHGYTRMFENMLDHANIKIMLNTDYREIAGELNFDSLIYTGPIDEFFSYCYGRLPYRSLRFRHKTLDRERLQPVAVVNYPSPSVRWTRVTEYKHLTGQQHPKTSVTYEFPAADGEPYYPIPTPQNAELFKKYQALADQTAGVRFVGRLATYRYYNMDQVVGQALALFAQLCREEGSPVPARLDAPASLVRGPGRAVVRTGRVGQGPRWEARRRAQP
jgi:UDP-galactopyranose mutase